MDTKLTLKLDKQVIRRAKQYAQKKNISLSQLIEGYLDKITAPNKGDDEGITPLVKSLSGVIKLPKNYDSGKAYRGHLTKKYS
jgi:hypothetical protein